MATQQPQPEPREADADRAPDQLTIPDQRTEVVHAGRIAQKRPEVAAILRRIHGI